MFQHDDVTLVGVGHWTCAREPQNLEYPFWSWRVSIDGVLLEDEEYINTGIGIHGKSGADKLIERLDPHLPKPIPEDFFDFPVHVPGDHTFLYLRLSNMLNPEGALVVLKEFFPFVFSRAEETLSP